VGTQWSCRAQGDSQCHKNELNKQSQRPDAIEQAERERQAIAAHDAEGIFSSMSTGCMASGIAFNAVGRIRSVLQPALGLPRRGSGLPRNDDPMWKGRKESL
jgi:hypothetical protein